MSRRRSIVDDDEALERVRAEDREALEEAIARGVERGAVNVVSTAAQVYVFGGCLLLLLKAIGWVLLGLVVLVLVKCGH
jgi:hypothetical protein